MAAITAEEEHISEVATSAPRRPRLSATTTEEWPLRLPEAITTLIRALQRLLPQPPILFPHKGEDAISSHPHKTMEEMQRAEATPDPAVQDSTPAEAMAISRSPHPAEALTIRPDPYLLPMRRKLPTKPRIIPEVKRKDSFRF